MNGQILLAVLLFVISCLCSYDAYHDKNGNFRIFSFAFAIAAIGELTLIFINLNFIKPWIN